MQIAATNFAVLGAVANRPAGAAQPFDSLIAGRCAADMNLVAVDIKRKVKGAGGHRFGSFGADQLGDDIEQTKSGLGAGRPLDSVRVADPMPQHLIAATQTQHRAAAPDVGLYIDIPSLGL